MTADPGERKFSFQLGHITFMGIDHEIIFMVILPLLQLLVSGKLCPQILVNHLED